jgi:hypothetical protein
MTYATENAEIVKLNPAKVVHAKPNVEYAPKQHIVLEEQSTSLAGTKLHQNYILGGHIDPDPLNTSFDPNAIHANFLIAGSKMDGPIFMGHFPGLKGNSPDSEAPVMMRNGRFLLLEGKGYKFQVVRSFEKTPTAYVPDTVGKGVDLSRADLEKAVMVDTDFSGCNLAGTNFTSANLKGCNFTGADLSQAKLNGANLSGASLVGANLSEADLGGAITSAETNFSFTYLVGSQFYSPTGKKHPYLGNFQGAIFAEGQTRIEVSNADFKEIAGLVDEQFACYFKFDVGLPKDVKSISTNRYSASRTESAS